jgi:hypothetical protein
MRRKNYIFAAITTLMWTACSSDQEALSQDAWADEGIEVEAFPNYEDEDADTRATICARPKTAWESTDVIYVRLNDEGKWYTLTYSDLDNKWKAPEGFTMSRNDTYEAVYAPLYELSDDGLSIVLSEGSYPFAGEYLTHKGKRPIRISFTRSYSRIRIKTNTDDTESEEDHWRHEENDRFGDKMHGMSTSSSPFLVTLGQGFTAPNGEPFTGEFSVKGDYKSNIYLYGNWEEGTTLNVKSGTTAEGLTISDMVDIRITQTSVPGNSFLVDASTTATVATYDLNSATSSFSDTQITDIAIVGEWNSEVAPSFENSTSLESVDLSQVEGLDELPQSMFGWCSNLTEVNLPEDLTSTGVASFMGCENLVMTSLPDGITEIGQSSFYYCKNLGLESLPESLETIAPNAFEFAYIAFDEIPEGVTVSSSSFYWSTFAEGTVLKLPEGMTGIEYQTFSVCKNLTGVIIPSTVTYLAKLAFGYCDNMNVVCYAVDPPQLDNTKDWESFHSTSGLTLQVPSESVDAYKSSDWNKYFVSITAIE